MDDKNKPSRSHATDSGPMPPDMPDARQRREDLPEGPIPGLPVSSDPLLQPMPKPAPREVPPLD